MVLASINAKDSEIANMDHLFGLQDHRNFVFFFSRWHVAGVNPLQVCWRENIVEIAPVRERIVR
jgi:hypothetical protein